METSFNQDLDGDGFTGAAPKNGGTASFSVTGSTKEGQILTINRSSTDPDGDDGNYNYQWQLSSNGGNSWQNIGDNNSTYTIRALDLGNMIRAQISYTDNKGFKEQVTTDIRNIPVPVSLANVETFGSYILAKNNDGDGYIAPAGTDDFILLTDKNGKPLGDKSYPGWKLIGADTVDGINRTAWKHDAYGFFFHKHDANWKEISGGSVEPVGSPGFYNMETSFAQDLDGDGFTGAAPKNGGTAQFFISGSKKTGQTLTINRSSTDPDGDVGNYNYQWQSSSDGGSSWQNIGDNNSTYTLRTLDLGNKIRAQISYTDTKGFKEEVTTDVLNIPVPVTVNNVETFGSYILAKNNDQDGYIAPAGTDDFILLTDKNGKPLGDKSYPGWKLIGADTVDGINRTTWKHDAYGFFFHKHDANWKEISGGSVVPVGSPAFYNLETSFNQDLDGDGFAKAPPKNGGTASFSVTGSTKEGQILTINRSSTDPDGDDGSYNYQWQSSSDGGSSWQNIGDNNSTHTITALDLGKKIRAQISYQILKVSRKK